MKMNIIELYSGTSDLTNELRKRGHNVIDIDWDEKTPAKVHCDISKLTIEDLRNMFPNKKIDFIWASPDCTTYSNAGLWYHRSRDDNGILKAKSDYAKLCDVYNQLLWENIINKCDCHYIVENPVGQYQKLTCITAPFISVVLYGDYGSPNKKPTQYFHNCFGLTQFLDEGKTSNAYIGVQNMHGYLKRGKVPHRLIMLLADFIEGEGR